MRKITNNELCFAGIHVIKTIVGQILNDLCNDPENALDEVRIGKRKKLALRIDVNAEDSFYRCLHKYKNGKYKDIKNFCGEERFRNPDINLSGESGIVGFVDAVDGTDLLERGLSNWCSAAIFFSPRNSLGKRIRAAFVGLPSGEVYYATSEKENAFVKRGKQPATLVSGPSSVNKLKDASICFYGQKIENFRSFANLALLDKLEEINCTDQKEKEERIHSRIYNLAGNPIIVKLVDKKIKVARGIDAVIDAKGQKPHDAVPGAFIALKAGAVLIDLRTGKNVDFVALENLLLKPASEESRLKYVLASTKELSSEILAAIGTPVAH